MRDELTNVNVLVTRGKIAKSNAKHLPELMKSLKRKNGIEMGGKKRNYPKKTVQTAKTE